MTGFLTLYMTVNWHHEFAVNFATFLKVRRDFFTFAPWFSSSPNHNTDKYHATMYSINPSQSDGGQISLAITTRAYVVNNLPVKLC